MAKDLWYRDAACLSMPDSMFYLSSVGEPQVRGMDLQEVTAYNLIKMKEAVAFCNSKCSVREECLEDATSDDLLRTVRGGLMPQLAPKKPKGRPTKNPDGLILTNKQRAEQGLACSRGHVNLWTTYMRDGRETYCCGECKREDQRRNYRSKGGGKALSGISRGKTCPYGHDRWALRKRGDYRCLECNRLEMAGKARGERRSSEICRKGHADRAVDYRGRSYCKECKRISRRAMKARQRANMGQ